MELIFLVVIIIKKVYIPLYQNIMNNINLTIFFITLERRGGRL